MTIVDRPISDILIFGNRKFAELAWHAFTHDSPHRVVGFTVNRNFITGATLRDLPVLAFEEIQERFDPSTTAIAMSIGWEQTNGLRQAKFQEARTKGFSIATYISRRALVWPELELGDGCLIFEGAIVQPFVRLGSAVILRSGCNISHHVEIGDFAFVSAKAVIGGGARLGTRSFVGLNATIRDGIRIGEGAIIGAGAAVLRDIEPGLSYASPMARRLR